MLLSQSSAEKGCELMKKTKILAILVAATMLASCAKTPDETEKTRKERETTTTTTTEKTTTEATPTPSPTPTPVPTEAPTPTPTTAPTPTPVPVVFENEYVTDLYADYEYMASDRPYHVPHINIDSEDAASINAEILEIMQRPISEYETNGYPHMYCSTYSMFLTDNGLLTIVFRLCGEWDDDDYYVWTIDVNTGARLSNSEIASAAGATDIRAAAVTALSEFCNRRYNYADDPEFIPVFINGELNSESPRYESMSDPEYYAYDEMQASFSEERLNADMCIGLDSDSHLIFISRVYSEAGSSSYNYCYASDGQQISSSF